MAVTILPCSLHTARRVGAGGGRRAQDPPEVNRCDELRLGQKLPRDSREESWDWDPWVR
jgi:hypothetical protein